MYPMQISPLFMDDEDTPPVQLERSEPEQPEFKRQRVHEQDASNLPAAKATGKPVLNTKALRSVLKGVIQPFKSLLRLLSLLQQHAPGCTSMH